MADPRLELALSETDVAFAGVAGQARLLREGRLSSVELVEMLLARIARLQPRLNAFRVVLAEQARQDAAAADAARRDADPRPLLGVPVAVKDNVAVAGVSSQLGTASAQPAAAADGEVVSRLRAAGLVVIGKTNLPELALWAHTESHAHGVTRNPWASSRTPGGSSGGSAAAVAAGMVAAAHATDGLGSIRIPAASCGLVGLKPGPGLVPMEPEPHWDGMSVAGFLTRTVEDTVLMLDAVGSPVRPVDPARLRIAVSDRAPVPTRVDPQVRAAWAAVADRLGAMGHEVLRRDPPYGVSTGAAGLVRSWFTGTRADLAGLADPGATEARTRRMAALGRVADPLLPWARRASQRAAARLDAFFRDLDVLLLPATATPPPPSGRDLHRGLLASMLANTRFAPFAAIWNLVGQPAIVLPAGRSADGLPLAVQLVARRGNEGVLLGLAAALQRELGWPARRPPVD